MAALIAGCATAAPRILHLPTYPTAPRIPAHVEVRLTRQFADYEFRESGASGFDPKIGAVLCSHAEALANAVFERVTVSRAPAPPAAADAVMTPTIITVRRTRPAADADDAHGIMEIGWRVEDARGRLVWVGTSKGEATGPFGTVFMRSSQMEAQLRQMLDRAFRHAYDLMIASPELHAIGGSVPRSHDRPAS